MISQCERVVITLCIFVHNRLIFFVKENFTNVMALFTIVEGLFWMLGGTSNPFVYVMIITRLMTLISYSFNVMICANKNNGDIVLQKGDE